jgi:two-component system sensor histidine kinase/response regulator
MSGAGERRPVVVIDDDYAMRLSCRKILEKLGLEVETHDNGAHGLEAVARLKPALVLVDLKMPGMSGMDVIPRVREIDADIAIVVITGYATIDTAVEAMKSGAYDFLPKPFSPDELRYGLRKASSQLILSRQARRLAAEARQIRFNFISVLAHELKSPINAVEGYLNILRDDVPEGDRRMVERSLLRLDGMKKLIFDLLDVTRIESGQKQRRFTDIDVAAIASAAIDLFELDATDKRVTISVDAPDAVPLHADAGEIEIVVNNLVSNAVKYNRDGGSVDVRLRRAGETVTLTVADTGIGLAPDEAAKLFNEFTRIKNEDTVTILGSGLGLSTVRKLARMYGGDATVVSTRGEGSTFTVTLHDATDAPPAA